MKKRAKNKVDTTKLLSKKHEGKWVAVTPEHDSIIAYANKLLELKEKVGDKKAVYFKALDSDKTYAFLCG